MICREPVGEMVASAEDVESIKQRLDAVDWAKLPVHGVYFGDPSPMSLGPGTVTECFLHGVDDAGTKYGADVTIVVGKTQGGEMPVTVQASTDVYTREGKLYAPASNVVGRVYHVRTLSDLRSRAAARHTDVK